MRTVDFQDDAVRLIDQTRLPHELGFVECRTVGDVADAIRRMVVRGAPAIGVAAAFGLALGASEYEGEDSAQLLAHLDRAAAELRATRPTAVNLAWAVDRSMRTAQEIVEGASGRNGGTIERVRAELLALAQRMADEDVAVNRRMGVLGAQLVPQQARILTHCNTGALACVDYGTAPFLQGARLTTWELRQEGIPHTLITDSMAGHFISRGQVDLAMVGADRVAANGDVANKIGTYTLAVVCKENRVPFYVVAPTSSIDLSLSSGADIPIEERPPEEVTHLAGQPIAPPGVNAAHPAFDVTPARYVTAIVTERGILRPPYEASLRTAAKGPAEELLVRA